MHKSNTQHNISSCLRIFTVVGLIACTGLVASAQQLEPQTNNRARNAPDSGEGFANEQTITFGAFSEPMELTTLIDYVGSSLNINIVVKGSPTGEIVFNAPKRIAKSKLIDFLDAMLELYTFTISYDTDSNFYIVQPIADVKPVFGTERATTLIIPTPNIKPSLLINALNAVLGSTTSGGTTSSSPIQAVDELGVLIVNAPPRDIKRVEMMVTQLLRLDADQQFIRFELDHLAAPTALNRIVALVGGSSTSSGTRTNQPRANTGNLPSGGNVAGAGGSTLSNLYERLTVDPQGNALIFKGNESEIDRVRKVLAVIDVPNTLQPKNYFAGSSASQIADIAKRRGLGEVILIEATQTQNPFNNFGGQNNQLNSQNTDLGQGGPVMVVDPARGSIIYYGTDDQQAQLAALLSELKTEDERVVIREYILNHTDALTIADLLNGIISGEIQTGDSALLPGGTGRGNANRTFINGFPINGDDESSGDFNPDQIAVIPDEFSNQIIIKAPIKQQGDLEKLISRLDRQRAQVYIEAMIVSVADNEDFTLAFETQINAGQYSMGTNFGLSSPGSDFQAPKSVTAGLGGLTQAVIMSEYVPIIVHATQTNANVRILSTPQLLVNDNEESTIMSVEEQPYSEITQGTGGGDNIQGLGGYVEVGTTLTVTPSISANGSVRLQYSIELSNFVGIASGGLPPATNRRTIDGSATVPSNATIVLGGITVEDIRDTVIKVPLLGDIPLIGELFKRTNKINNKSKLYVFLTPRIMIDPNFNDLKLFSKGPQAEMEVDSDLPELEPAIIMAPGVVESSVLPTSLPSSDSPAKSSTSSLPVSAPELEPAFIDLPQTSAKGSE